MEVGLDSSDPSSNFGAADHFSDVPFPVVSCLSLRFRDDMATSGNSGSEISRVGEVVIIDGVLESLGTGGRSSTLSFLALTDFAS